MGDILTTQELAEKLKVSADTIRLWTREGSIPRLPLSRKVIRYDMAEVLNAIRTQRDRTPDKKPGTSEAKGAGQ